MFEQVYTDNLSDQYVHVLQHNSEAGSWKAAF